MNGVKWVLLRQSKLVYAPKDNRVPYGLATHKLALRETSLPGESALHQKQVYVLKGQGSKLQAALLQQSVPFWQPALFPIPRSLPEPKKSFLLVFAERYKTDECREIQRTRIYTTGDFHVTKSKCRQVTAGSHQNWTKLLILTLNNSFLCPERYQSPEVVK